MPKIEIELDVSNEVLGAFLIECNITISQGIKVNRIDLVPVYEQIYNQIIDQIPEEKKRQVI